MKAFVVMVVCLWCWQCSAPRYPAGVREALAAAGENRGELERVLAHYAAAPGDSLKWQAACFLIANMPGHYTAGGKMLDSLRRRIDRDTAGYFARKAMDLLVSAMPELDDPKHRQEDVQCVTAEYLIEHIDACFALRERFPWYGEVSRSDFFRYVLPYRLGHERLDGWRDSITPVLPEKYRISSTIQRDLEEARKYLSLPDGQVAGFSDTLVSRLYGELMGACRYLSLMRLCLRRMAGMPAAVDYIPCYPDRNGFHYWRIDVDSRKLNPYMEDALQRKPAKVFRETFERHAVPEARKGEFMPELFRDPFLEDVTDEYLHTADVTVPAAFRVAGRPEHAYLCVFNDLDWQPTAIGTWEGGKAHFTGMGKGIVYLPVYYEGRRMRAFHYPFVLTASGTAEFLVPEEGKRLALHLERKYPYDEVQYEYSHVLCGARIEVSNDACSFDSIGCFPAENHYYFSAALPDSLPACRYWQVRAASRVCVAELRFYDAEGNLLGPDSLSGDRLAFDGDELTYLISYDVRAVFREPVRVARVVCLPRSDGNGVYPGDEYELLYYAADGWRSLGRQRATDYSVDYGDVPAGALYWLRNRTKGVEERVFTVEDGQARFW